MRYFPKELPSWVIIGMHIDKMAHLLKKMNCTCVQILYIIIDVPFNIENVFGKTINSVNKYA